MQGKRDKADKERPVLAAVRGDVHRGGSVRGLKRRVGAKSCGTGSLLAKKRL